MKLTTNSLVTKAALVLVLALILTTATAGQVARAQKPIFKPNAIANLIVGINSENDGLRKSAIYFAGKYDIDQAVDPLIEQLKVEKNPSLRLLIALSLYKIGNEKGLDAIYANVLLEKDPHVKRMCNAIFEEYKSNKNIFASKTY
jgi:HEAT repeat protein